MDLLMVLMKNHDLSESTSVKTSVTPDCKYPGGGNKYLSSGKINGHWSLLNAVGSTLLRTAA